MFIEIVDSRSGRQEASVDVAQDYDEFDIDVFIEMEEFSATCKVGNYILGTIFLNSCVSNECRAHRAHDLATTRVVYRDSR